MFECLPQLLWICQKMFLCLNYYENCHSVLFQFICPDSFWVIIIVAASIMLPALFSDFHVLFLTSYWPHKLGIVIPTLSIRKLSLWRLQDLWRVCCSNFLWRKLAKGWKKAIYAVKSQDMNKWQQLYLPVWKDRKWCRKSLFLRAKVFSSLVWS